MSHKETIITGIQQIGVGVEDVPKAKKWYRDIIGATAQIFDDEAEANLMLPYTGGKPHFRRAALTVNMNGGGGFEIWQFTSRKSAPRLTPFQFGDYGINASKIKCKDINKAHQYLENKGVNNLSPIFNDAGYPYFYFQDLNGNYIQICLGDSWFKNPTDNPLGGVKGAVIGVKDIHQSAKLYKDVLGIDTVVLEGAFTVPNYFYAQETKYKKLILKKPCANQGAFSKLLGEIEIELIEVENPTLSPIFYNRFWGDQGYIHLCFDTLNMELLKQESERLGFPFTVDSGKSFGMGTAAGRFAYCEDPSGALIEFVETHKVPILKKLGLYLKIDNSKKKPLANWMINLLGLSKVQ